LPNFIKHKPMYTVGGGKTRALTKASSSVILIPNSRTTLSMLKWCCFTICQEMKCQLWREKHAHKHNLY